jgi:hypothetical protein
MKADMFRWHRLLTVACLVALALLVGCGKRTKTVPVSGIVKIDGVPLKDARVTFHPIDGGKMAFGNTDAEGRFTLTTSNSNDGAVPGQYRVTVSVVGSFEAASDKIAKDFTMGEMQRERERLAKMKINQVHPNYLTVDKTPLRQEITGPTSDLPIDLRKDGSG